MSRLTRRSFVAAAPALAWTGRARATSSKDVLVRGLTTYSESAMVMCMSPDGQAAATLRFCRFPDAGQTWLWCHLVVDREMYAFTSHDLPCGLERLAGSPDASYSASPTNAALVREGSGAALKSVLAEASLRMHRSRTAPHGPGPIPGRLRAIFTPTHALGAEVLGGRDEVYGTVRGEVEVGGRRFALEGPAKFHEQKQEAPRFLAPFCYSWLAGDDRAATTLLIARGATGGWALKDGDAALKDMAIDPPGDHREADYRLRSGRRMTGTLDAVVRYEVPVYGRTWNGSFVRGVVDGKAVVGVANDWLVAPDIYAAARARIGPA